MTQVRTTGSRHAIAGEIPLTRSLQQRVTALEALVRAIEDELSDDALSDELKLQHIGERVAGLMDGY